MVWPKPRQYKGDRICLHGREFVVEHAAQPTDQWCVIVCTAHGQGEVHGQAFALTYEDALSKAIEYAIEHCNKWPA